MLNEYMHFEDSLITFNLYAKGINVKIETNSQNIQDVLSQFKDFLKGCGYSSEQVNLIDFTHDPYDLG